MTIPKTSLVQNPRWHSATVGLLVIVAAMAAWTLPSYGATWDEENVVKQGADFVLWYASGFQDDRVIDPLLDRNYGAVFSGTIGVLTGAMGRVSYEVQHVLISLFGMAGLVLAAWIGTTLGGPAAGFLSALFLCLTPVYYGHAFNNPKDIPFAVLALGSFAAIVRAWPSLPRIGLPNIIVIGAAIGLTLGVRVIGVIVFVYVLLGWLAWLVWKAWPFSRLSMVASLARPLVVAGSGIFVVAWAVMIFWWPYAQLNPVLNPLRALGELSRFSWDHPVRFEGRDILSSELPWTYLPVWFANTLPEFYGVAAILGIAGLVAWRRSTTAIDISHVILIVLLWISVILPVVLVIVRRSVLYDGVRHLLFVVPPLAIGLAIGVAAFFQHVRSRTAHAIAWTALILTAAATIADMVRLHPYQSVYFNRLIAGGLEGAAGRFETDYWGQSYKEGVEWLAANISTENGQPLRVANCDATFLTGYYLDKSPALREKFRSVEIDDDPDIVLATTRWNCHEKHPGRVMHVVARMGVPLCYVIDVRRRDPRGD